jgi:hypothetical protein
MHSSMMVECWIVSYFWPADLFLCPGANTPLEPASSSSFAGAATILVRLTRRKRRLEGRLDSIVDLAIIWIISIRSLPSFHEQAPAALDRPPISLRPGSSRKQERARETSSREKTLTFSTTRDQK